MEATYDIFYTPVVAQGIAFPDEYLAQLTAAGYSSITHEPLQRYASEDFANGYTAWWAFRRDGDDEMEDAESVDANGAGLDGALDFPEIDDPRGGSLDHQELPTFTYSATPLPNLPSEPHIFETEQEASDTLFSTTSAMQLPDGLQDDIEVLAEKKAQAVKLLYKAICSMPVRTGPVELSQQQTVQDVRADRVNELVNYLAQYRTDITHLKLSSLADLLFRAIIKLHNEGYTVNMPAKYRSSDKHLTAVERLEALMQYLSDMKSLVLKCLQEGVDGIGEVVAFPKMLFEQLLSGEVVDSGDEERVEEVQGLDQEESAVGEAADPGAPPSLTMSATPASASGFAPATSQATQQSTPRTTNPRSRGPRRRLRPKMASNFL
ncbi:hypothetical protein M409DRAFT_58200 [Zasmidium cellare ATCC 36951]|uniref:Uncharacterized protein n=1 Tax=Zasmidium cellare ATCC 36951 TaxID=1080233 RepID=A0A6A6C848_ZASCE|nr:uncharacterized protein M409DRAFT_58200 [Zasmidium cellare ATCC 36951]KAF2162428.1 hypothetical protein M409DRAFT_58200 [Zasmidium cellare ATCC 36951]